MLKAIKRMFARKSRLHQDEAQVYECDHYGILIHEVARLEMETEIRERSL